MINIISECLSISEKSWFLKFFQQLAQMGIATLKKEKQPHFAFVSIFMDIFPFLFYKFDIDIKFILNSH